MSTLCSGNKNMKLYSYTGFVLEQDGKVYDLYNLPENFVIKGDVYLAESDLLNNALPDLSTVTVLGSFDCSKCGLTSLKGAPKEVHGDFRCDYNKLKNFVGAPKIVKGNIYYMTYGPLGENILRGFPKKFNEFYGSLYCTYFSFFSPRCYYFVPKRLYDAKLADKIHIDGGENVFKQWLVDNEARKKQLLQEKQSRNASRQR